ncbi:MAG: hypothetical protein MI861_18930 [Pirellulales bacterium]|nr:hypothetical protein [Pirellulales bacterium]
MWRALFLAIGLMAVIVGFECLVIESASVYSAGETQASNFVNPLGEPSASTLEWRPQEWFPWVLLAAGAITILYAFTLPGRWRRAVAE